jgi:hypothetical protein
VRTFGRISRVRAYYVWSPVGKIRLRTVSKAGSPLIITRASWRADEKIRRRKKPAYADALRFAVVHHTVGSNSYSRAQSASIVRGIERYHVLANGWDSIAIYTGRTWPADHYSQVTVLCDAAVGCVGDCPRQKRPGHRDVLRLCHRPTRGGRATDAREVRNAPLH